ncbi:hypothetical protein TrCOL_g1835 [Triparma columacea]|uniref:non-specific serine/threonine protein kinase n=1 Tax=Triparma columacea TaxID=722753 RepID=A0A9W7G235_9STRA|nr:hypothetical protein TrCOL_g1835 [Triparma columacea]
MDDETGRLWMVCEVNDAMFVKDVASVMHLEHKNLVRYVVPSSTSTTSSSTTIPIFGELCSGGPLSSLLESIVDDCDVPSSLSLNVVASYLLQITSGLAYLHSQGHFHGGSLGVCVENVFLCRGNILKLANYFPYSSRSWEEHELSRHQSKDVRDLGNLAAHLFTMDDNLDLPAAARSFVQECNKEGTKAKLLLQHPFLRGALNENPIEHSSTRPQNIGRISSSGGRSSSTQGSPNPTLDLQGSESSSSIPLPYLSRGGSVATSGGSTPPTNNRKKAPSEQQQPSTNRSAPNAWEGLEDFESFSTTESLSLAASNPAAALPQTSAPPSSTSKKLTIAQKAFLKNAGGGGIKSNPPKTADASFPVPPSSSSDSGGELQNSKNQAYEMMRKRREMSNFIDNLEDASR